jgi:pyruvate,water dikinase
MFKFLKKIARSSNGSQDHQAFRFKYQRFRELLERNNEVLETISLLSDIREHNQWISLGRLRSLVTRTAVNVYRLVENLNYISEGRYEALDKIFTDLEKNISASLEVRPQASTGPLAIPLAQANIRMERELGGKAATLGEISRILGVRVPSGTAFTTYAYSRFVEHNGLFKHIDKELLLLDPDDTQGLVELSQRLQNLIMQAEVPAELLELLEQGYIKLQKPGSKPVPVVIRSSAVGEDSPGISFAGLYQSILNPQIQNLEEAYKSVMASKFSSRVLTYSMKKGIYHDLCPMGVLLMELVPCKAAGVMFTKNPHGQKDTVDISAVWGLGKLAVNGSVMPDQIKVTRTMEPSIAEIVNGHKSHMLELGRDGGLVDIPVPEEMQDAPCLTEDQIDELARLGMQLEKFLGAPQDVEWVIDHHDRIHVVQCRPLHMEQAILDWPDYYPWQEMAAAGEPLFSNLQVGSTGAAYGKPLLIKHPHETGPNHSKPIFLVGNTAPDLVNILPKARGIVAERGNTSGHLAIIAREFEVPLVIGCPLEQAEKLTSLKRITLDAFTGSIYPGKLEPLLDAAQGIKDHEKKAPASPLHILLDDVLQYITPLNLTNPRDPSFRPQSVSTIHDIIRFVHEMAINAMFEINDDHMTSQGKVERLRSEVPLDIYIIDLGGGLAEHKSRQKVNPADIVSLPMKSLYEGMTTEGVRWAGHVPIDFRGFMSVFANTMFDGAKYERKLGDRSYAILSQNYCNFSSRLGYHFSIVDAFLGDDEHENYISFRFKGGAARIEKRTRRARFLSEVLRRCDFWVDQKYDLINARIKRIPQKQMKEKLRMLGRLMGCSRQLDVTMYNEKMVQHYVSLFLKGDYSMGYGDSPDMEKVQ